MALRERAKMNSQTWAALTVRQNPPTLGILLSHADSEDWFAPVEHELRWEQAYLAAYAECQLRAVEVLKQSGSESAKVSKPSEEDVNRHYESISDPIGPMLEAAKNIRNNLAHGSVMLDPNSAVSLRQTARLINALF